MLKVRSVMAASVVFAAAVVQAQNYPLPVAASQPTVYCKACPAPSTNLPLYSYPASIKSFTGRFVDSQETRDYQTAPFRTLRARAVAFAPQNNRIYMTLGSHFAAYDASTFFDRLRTSPLAQVSGRMELTPVAGERYLVPNASVYPESDSAWQTSVVDGQDRLFGFDWDDRGYAYLAYSTFRWGIVQEPTLGLVAQGPSSGVTPVAALSLKSGGRYYALISDGFSRTAVFDVTTPATPQLVRTISYAPYGAASTPLALWTKATVDGVQMVAIIAGGGSVNFWSAEALVNGDAPEFTLRPSTNAQFTSVTTDGRAFFAAEGSYYQPTSAIAVVSGPSAAKLSVQRFVQERTFVTSTLRYGDGFLAQTGSGADGRNTVRVHRLSGDTPIELDLNGYFRNAYTFPPSGYARPAGYSSVARDAIIVKKAGRPYLIYAGGGIGDVYELPQVATSDFNGDGENDIVLRNYTTGQNALWLMNGTGLKDVSDLPALPNCSYRIEGAADFDFNGSVDIVLRNYSTGQNAIWLMDGTSISGIVDLPALPNTDFHFEGSADLNGDRKPDLILRNYETGQNAVWLMNGTALSAIVDLPALTNRDYRIEGAADFDHDGNPDIVLRNYATGQDALWMMNGTALKSIYDLPALPNTSYRIDAIGDVDRDGNVDIILRNGVTGQNAVWMMDENRLRSVVDLPALPNTAYEINAPR